MRPPRPLRAGAQDLVDYYQCNELAIVEAHVRGEIPRGLADFVWDVIDADLIGDVERRLNRESWRLASRVEKLEEEVRELKAICRRCQGREYL